MFGHEFVKQLQSTQKYRKNKEFQLATYDDHKLDTVYQYWYNNRGMRYRNPYNFYEATFCDWEQIQIERKEKEVAKARFYENELKEFEDQIASLIKRRVECRNIIRKANPNDPEEKEQSVRAHFEIIRIDEQLEKIDTKTGLVELVFGDPPQFHRKVKKFKKKITRAFTRTIDSIKDFFTGISDRVSRVYRRTSKKIRKTFRKVRKFCRRNSDIVIGITTALVGYITKRIFFIPSKA